VLIGLYTNYLGLDIGAVILRIWIPTGAFIVFFDDTLVRTSIPIPYVSIVAHMLAIAFAITACFNACPRGTNYHIIFPKCLTQLTSVFLCQVTTIGTGSTLIIIKFASETWESTWGAIVFVPVPEKAV
jgi:hypothetical protein